MSGKRRDTLEPLYGSENNYNWTHMDEIISAADANRSFSRVLRTVRQGRHVVVTSHGRPVARIGPIDERHGAGGEPARAALLARLRSQRTVNAGRWTRDELYEDER